MMEAQFEAMEGRLEELTVATAQPEIIADVPKWQGMLKEMAQLEPAVNAWRQYRQLLSEIEQAKEMRSDPDMADMAEEELKELLPREEQEREKLRLFLIPHDPNDDRSVVMEIRPGAGGEEAALFAALLLRMYQRYAERAGFQFEAVDISDTELGGVKEAVFTLNGAGAFSRMKYESGVHRIQRVPVTEAGILLRGAPAEVADLRMRFIASVGQAEFPFLIGLIPHGIDHFLQEGHWRIIQRYQDAEGNLPRKAFRLLAFPLLFFPGQ